jgi:hypothetical protein
MKRKVQRTEIVKFYNVKISNLAAYEKNMQVKDLLLTMTKRDGSPNWGLYRFF